MYYPRGHKVKFGLDWLPLVVDGRMVFQIQVAGASVEVPIDLNRLDPLSRKEIDAFIGRQQDHFLTSYEAVRGAAWVVDVMLQQQHPELTKIARDAQVWTILGVQDPPSYKEPFFQAMGETFLETIQSRQEFEESTRKRHFDRVFLSWRRALYTINFGEPLPPQLKTVSRSEAEELEVFSCALRFTDDVSRVYRDYASVAARYAGNGVFSRWVDRIIARRDKPGLNRLGLTYWLLCGWLHLFLWGCSNEDRLQILVRITAMYPPTQERRTINLNAGAIKKAAERLGLLGWSNFPETYRKPLWTLDLERERKP
jgi:hypothetical protein